MRTVQVRFINTISKITNLITTLDFIQSEPVGDAVKEATYLIGFMDAEGQPISNEITHVADSREEARPSGHSGSALRSKIRSMMSASRISWSSKTRKRA